MSGALRRNLKMKIQKEKKAAAVSANAPMEWDNDSGARLYNGRVVLDGDAKLPDVAELENGCLRFLFKVQLGLCSLSILGLIAPSWMLMFIIQTEETENMFTSNGCFYIRLDLPGIGPGQELVWPEENGTAVLYGTDQANATQHDNVAQGFICRFDQRCGCCRVGLPKHEMKNGVLRLLVPKIKVAVVCLWEMGKPYWKFGDGIRGLRFWTRIMISFFGRNST